MRRESAPANLMVLTGTDLGYKRDDGVIVCPPATHHSQSGDQKGALGGLVLPVKKPAVDCPVIECWLK